MSQDALSDDAFLAEAKTNDEWLRALTLEELKRTDSRLLVSVWTSTDRVAHMFWRFRDPKHALYTAEGAKKYGRAVEDTYKRMDEIVGAVRKELAPDDLLMVLSDHGFHSFRKGFSVNTWLVRNGYLVLKGKPDAATAFTEKGQDYLDLDPSKSYIDWSKTKVYGLGLGSLYINQKGREGKGIVDPADVPKLVAELKEKLLKVTDPDGNAKVLNAVYARDEYKGLSAAVAPDLQLGYAEGYQTAQASRSGGAPKELFEINNDKWSGEHASSDVSACSGIYLSNKATGKDAAIEDLGVTALKFLGLQVPKEFHGKPLL